LVAAILAVVALVRGAAVLRPVIALVLGLGVAAVPAPGYVLARSVPPINDISTDPNEQSDAQRRAYPEIQPLRLPVARRDPRGGRWAGKPGRRALKIACRKGRSGH
jgi:hypothetical protein